MRLTRLALLLFALTLAAAPSRAQATADKRPTWFIFLETGKQTPADKEAVQKMQAGHIQNFKRLFGEKKLFAAGPLQDPAGKKRGIVVVKAKSKAELLTYFQPDDYVREGYMVANAEQCVAHKPLNTAGIDPEGIEEERMVQITRPAKKPTRKEKRENDAFIQALVDKGTVGAWYTLESGNVAEVLFCLQPLADFLARGLLARFFAACVPAFWGFAFLSPESELFASTTLVGASLTAESFAESLAESFGGSFAESFAESALEVDESLESPPDVSTRLRFFSPSPLKSVSYQPPPFKRNDGADMRRRSCDLPHSGHFRRAPSLIFCSASRWWPQAPQRYSYIGIVLSFASREPGMIAQRGGFSRVGVAIGRSVGRHRPRRSSRRVLNALCRTTARRRRLRLESCRPPRNRRAGYAARADSPIAAGSHA